MSTVVAFPVERCSRRVEAPAKDQSARIYILPVVRIERHDESNVKAAPPRHPAPGKPHRLLS